MAYRQDRVDLHAPRYVLANLINWYKLMLLALNLSCITLLRCFLTGVSEQEIS